MKKHEDSLIPEDWKKAALKDWERIKRNIREDDAEAAGYYFADRYPPIVESKLTCKEIKKDIEEAERFIKTMFGENA